ncbi:MAG: discoidin domain-containing protein, partial [Methylococcales bacterium]|nr:discoidin domain-containing protein [Methylococcales bacterium]
ANLALGSQVQASSTYSSGYAPSYSVDGNIGTSWVSSTIQNTYKQQWLMLDLGQSKTVQEVTLNWFGNNHAGQMAVWSWNGSQWLLLSQKTKGQGQDVLSFNAVNTQHLMVTFSYGSYGRWYIVTELEVK